MKTLNTIFLILLSVVAFSQTSKNNVDTSHSIIISNYVSQNKCGYKAIKIINNEVLIDTCFNQKENTFVMNRTEPNTKLEFFSSLRSLSNAKWQQMQNDLDAVTGCDYAMPFEVQILESGKLFKYSLKRFGNCYPISAKLLMEGLEEYFSKLK